MGPCALHRVCTLRCFDVECARRPFADPTLWLVGGARCARRLYSFPEASITPRPGILLNARSTNGLETACSCGGIRSQAKKLHFQNVHFWTDALTCMRFSAGVALAHSMLRCVWGARRPLTLSTITSRRGKVMSRWNFQPSFIRAAHRRNRVSGVDQRTVSFVFKTFVLMLSGRLR
jgi:hypothetical protein